MVSLEKLDELLNNLAKKYNDNTEDLKLIIEIFLRNSESDVNKELIIDLFINCYLLWVSVFESDIGIINGLENLKYDEIIDLYYNNNEFRKTVINLFIKIMNSPNLKELTDENRIHLDNLKCLKKQKHKVCHIGDIINCYLEDLYQEYIDDDENVLFHIYQVLITDNDVLDTYLKYFNSLEEYLMYKPLIIERLYCDAYLFLLQEKEQYFLPKDTFKMFLEIKKRFRNNDIYKLPSSIDDSKFLLQSFYYFNTNRDKLINQFPKSLETLKRSLNKKHSLFLLDY